LKEAFVSFTSFSNRKKDFRKLSVVVAVVVVVDKHSQLNVD